MKGARNLVTMPGGEVLCTVPIEAALDCGHTFFGKYIEIIIGMLREHGAVVVFSANLDQFSLPQLGANLAENARVDAALRQDPGGDPALCTHQCRNTPVVFTSQGPRCKVHEPNVYSATSPVTTVADRQAAAKSPCGHAIDQLRYDVPLRTIRCVQCAQEDGKGAS